MTEKGLGENEGKFCPCIHSGGDFYLYIVVLCDSMHNGKSQAVSFILLLLYFFKPVEYSAYDILRDPDTGVDDGQLIIFTRNKVIANSYVARWFVITDGVIEEVVDQLEDQVVMDALQDNIAGNTQVAG